MFKKIFLLCVFTCLTLPLFAQYDNETRKRIVYGTDEMRGSEFNFVSFAGREATSSDFKLGPGMEFITVGGVNIVAPQGTKVEDKGSWIKIEDVGEYLGRRFQEIRERLQAIEAAQGEIKQDIEKLKQEVGVINKRSLDSKP